MPGEVQKPNDPTTGADSLGKALRRNLSAGRIRLQAGRLWGTLRSRGFEAAAREVAFRYRLATHRETWRYRADIPLRRELKAQRKAVFDRMPLISIVAPLYNTKPEHLRQMLDSVCAQSYARWELVLPNASDRDHAYVAQIVQEYAEADARIRHLRLFRNAGIAQNSNLGFLESDGQFIALLDHDDALQPNALYEVVRALNETDAELIYSDEIVLDDTLSHLVEYHFKPDYAPDTLRGCNYITHLCVFSRRLLKRVGGNERAEFDGAQDYDLILRLTEKARAICHIPKVLYFWRQHAGSTASGIAQKPAALAAGAAALTQHLARLDFDGTVRAQEDHPGAYHVRYPVWGQPLVSVLIPNKDHIEDLERCLTSLYERAGYEHLEVLVLDNNSEDPATPAYYEAAEERFEHLRVLRYPGAFNFAAICNFGAARAKGDHLLLLNNDTELIRFGFVAELLSYSQRPDVGAVGALLYYPDDTVQHAGLIIGIGGTAGVSHKGHKRNDGGDMFRLCTAQNVSAVTGACLMLKASLYRELEGMDEARFAVAFNDVDLCLRLREMGLWNIFTPFAEAYHYESKSRGYDTDGPAKERFDREAAALRERHAAIFAKGDPFYNPHFTLKTENFALA